MARLMINAAHIKATVDVIRFYEQETGAKLKINGNNWASIECCPFGKHSKKNSFQVNLNSQGGVFYCHACKTKGDVVDFIMRKYGLDFKVALKKLSNDHIGGASEVYEVTTAKHALPLSIDEPSRVYIKNWS